MVDSASSSGICCIYVEFDYLVSKMMLFILLVIKNANQFPFPRVENKLTHLFCAMKGFSIIDMNFRKGDTLYGHGSIGDMSV